MGYRPPLDPRPELHQPRIQRPPRAVCAANESTMRTCPMCGCAEAAGYEHVAAPEIRIGGIEVTPLDKRFDYLVDAELTMELIGKPS